MVNFKVMPFGNAWKAVQIEEFNGVKKEIRKSYHKTRQYAELKRRKYVNEFWGGALLL